MAGNASGFSTAGIKSIGIVYTRICRYRGVLYHVDQVSLFSVSILGLKAVKAGHAG